MLALPSGPAKTLTQGSQDQLELELGANSTQDLDHTQSQPGVRAWRFPACTLSATIISQELYPRAKQNHFSLELPNCFAEEMVAVPRAFQTREKLKPIAS